MLPLIKPLVKHKDVEILYDASKPLYVLSDFYDFFKTIKDKRLCVGQLILILKILKNHNQDKDITRFLRTLKYVFPKNRSNLKPGRVVNFFKEYFKEHSIHGVIDKEEKIYEKNNIVTEIHYDLVRKEIPSRFYVDFYEANKDKVHPYKSIDDLRFTSQEKKAIDDDARMEEKSVHYETEYVDVEEPPAYHMIVNACMGSVDTSGKDAPYRVPASHNGVEITDEQKENFTKAVFHCCKHGQVGVGTLKVFEGLEHLGPLRIRKDLAPDVKNFHVRDYMAAMIRHYGSKERLGLRKKAIQVPVETWQSTNKSRLVRGIHNKLDDYEKAKEKHENKRFEPEEYYEVLNNIVDNVFGFENKKNVVLPNRQLYGVQRNIKQDNLIIEFQRIKDNIMKETRTTVDVKYKKKIYKVKYDDYVESHNKMVTKKKFAKKLKKIIPEDFGQGVHDTLDMKIPLKKKEDQTITSKSKKKKNRKDIRLEYENECRMYHDEFLKRLGMTEEEYSLNVAKVKYRKIEAYSLASSRCKHFKSLKNELMKNRNVRFKSMVNLVKKMKKKDKIFKKIKHTPQSYVKKIKEVIEHKPKELVQDEGDFTDEVKLFTYIMKGMLVSNYRRTDDYEWVYHYDEEMDSDNDTDHDNIGDFNLNTSEESDESDDDEEDSSSDYSLESA